MTGLHTTNQFSLSPFLEWLISAPQSTQHNEATEELGRICFICPRQTAQQEGHPILQDMNWLGRPCKTSKVKEHGSIFWNWWIRETCRNLIILLDLTALRLLDIPNLSRDWCLILTSAAPIQMIKAWPRETQPEFSVWDQCSEGQGWSYGTARAGDCESVLTGSVQTSRKRPLDLCHLHHSVESPIWSWFPTPTMYRVSFLLASLSSHSSASLLPSLQLISPI